MTSSIWVTENQAVKQVTIYEVEFWVVKVFRAMKRESVCSVLQSNPSHKKKRGCEAQPLHPEKQQAAAPPRSCLVASGHQLTSYNGGLVCLCASIDIWSTCESPWVVDSWVIFVLFLRADAWLASAESGKASSPLKTTKESLEFGAYSSLLLHTPLLELSPSQFQHTEPRKTQTGSEQFSGQ